MIGEGSASRDLVRGCMWVDERSSSNNSANASAKGDESGSEGEMDVEADNRSKIAWRYGGMEKFKTSIGALLPSLLRTSALQTRWLTW